MNVKKRKLILYVGLIIVIICVGVILYSSYRSVNRVPDKAKLVKEHTTFHMMG